MYFLIIIFFAVGATIGIAKGYRHWRAPTTNFVGKRAICIIAAGGLGFVEPFWIQLFPGELLNRFELPNALTAPRAVVEPSLDGLSGSAWNGALAVGGVRSRGTYGRKIRTYLSVESRCN